MKGWQLTVALWILATLAGWLAPDSRRPSEPRPAAFPAAAAIADIQRSLPPEPSGLILDELSLTAADAMLSHDQRIKLCFQDAQGSMGYLPSVIVHAHVLASGVVDQALVAEPARLHGTELDLCLTTALEHMRFPPFVGEAVWLTYPFKF